MSDLETTQSKLRSTPTAGVSGEHSAYYRRLLSAGYKGHIQGSIGGATLYGVMGLAVGAMVAIPAAFFLGPALLLAIPAVGGLGVIHGAHTFSDIGKTAAIIAESADASEKRRYLIDRYYETPNDAEAEAIKKMLEDQMKPQVPEKMFHWKTVLIGAALGLVFTAGFMLLAGIPWVAAGATGAAALGEGVALHSIFGAITEFFITHGISGLTATAIGTGLGTAAGAMIGLDREYVRRWLDHAEFSVHDQTDTRSQIIARAQEVSLLADASLRDMRQHQSITADTVAETPILDKVNSAPALTAALPSEPASAPPTTAISTRAIAPSLSAASRPDPLSPEIIAGLTLPNATAEQPKKQVHAGQLQDRLTAIHQAMATPVV